MEDTALQLVEIKEEMPEVPNYLKEQRNSTYVTIIFPTIIVVCAIISLIVNIKRKATIRIVCSIILPMIAITVGKLLEVIILWNVSTNGRETSSDIFIIATLIIMLIILLTLVIMIFKKKKNKV